ncbi:flagellar biosynthesis protein FliO [Bacteriovorax sp. BAL6_X]|uniref:flagellar biosynthetic protein FliO n=1 Tax=Bacteriovorax sp. BAL6_X TaxID=1201290 RepID=UPI000385650D|nr:flagellar biosynthetic protein FliO [Bacteriovorax sp. BAL6_X]EPZ50155.1 flagellar biosynthesis protein FliO [Bacteriovorax sp. BAL6_X]
MARQLKLLFLALSLMTTNAFARVEVGKVKLTKSGSTGIVTVGLKGKFDTTPELTIKDDIIQVALKDTIVWPKIEKQVSVNEKFDTKLLAYQFTKDVARVRAILPYDIKGNEDKVSLEVSDNEIKMYFPITANKKQVAVTKAAPTKKDPVKQKNAEAYDEGYLAKLLKDKEEVTNNKNKNNVKLEKTSESLLALAKEKNEQIEDTVSNLSSGVEKGGFQMSTYIFKFIGFFALFAAGIFFLMNFFRKGMLKKGGLGLFSNAKMVEVLSTTYLAPKRSLLVVRVQKQVFLMAQSEKGMDFLTEIQDTTEFFKEGEKALTGSNFDTNLDTANSGSKEFKLKEVTQNMKEASNSTASSQQDILNSLAGQANQEEKVSLTAQIKKKVKDMKSLQ